MKELFAKDAALRNSASVGPVSYTHLDVYKRQCVDDLGSEGVIFRNCQEAMLGGRLPELKERVQKDGILRMDQILEVQELGNLEVNSIIEQAISYLGIALANMCIRDRLYYACDCKYHLCCAWLLQSI